MGGLTVPHHYGRGHPRIAAEESRWWVLLGARVSEGGFKGMEASRAGKPGGEPVTDVYVFACLVSISSSSGNGTQHIGKPFVSSCPFPGVGSRLMSSNLGTLWNDWEGESLLRDSWARQMHV